MIILRLILFNIHFAGGKLIEDIFIISTFFHLLPPRSEGKNKVVSYFSHALESLDPFTRTVSELQMLMQPCKQRLAHWEKASENFILKISSSILDSCFWPHRVDRLPWFGLGGGPVWTGVGRLYLIPGLITVITQTILIT